MMKYLVTFAWAKEVDCVKDFEYDEYSGRDASDPVTESINKINFHSVIVKTDEKNQLSDKIKEEKEAFLKIKEQEIENLRRTSSYWQKYQDKYRVDWIRCVGITPIANDEIEIAIKEHCCDEYDGLDDERQYIVLKNRLDTMIKELFPQVFKAKFTQEHIERIIELAIAYFYVDCCYNELDDFFESKFSDIYKEWLDGYKSLISEITHHIYNWYYNDIEDMSLEEYLNEKREEILDSMKKYM